MKPTIWQKCIKCKTNCCKQKKISYPLFLTKEEVTKFLGINDYYPCKFLNKKSLCGIHSQRPTDCRLFPFDIVKWGDKFFWVYWKTNCPITKKGTQSEWENCLKDIETTIIPNFKNYIEAYSQHRFTEFFDNFGKYIILREVNY